MNKTFPYPARIVGAGIAVAFFALAPLAGSSAYAQPREHERERFRSPHWVFDDRFHHNHYYPSVGYSLSVLPAGNIAVTFRNGRFFFHSGVWYQRVGPSFVVVRPPPGIVVPVLPPAYATVWVGGVPYYYANDIYYVQRPDGYAVATQPMEPAAGSVGETPPPPASPPQAAAPAPPAPSAPGSWYYCESAKGYYPYVSECREGWRAVPAAPPQAR
jgi:hypothetical protein